MRPNFAEYLRKIYDLTGGELRIINQYEVGEGLALSSIQTDEIVDQLCDAGMIKKIDGNKVILRSNALYAIEKNKT